MNGGPGLRRTEAKAFFGEEGTLCGAECARKQCMTVGCQLCMSTSAPFRLMKGALHTLPSPLPLQGTPRVAWGSCSLARLQPSAPFHFRQCQFHPLQLSNSSFDALQPMSVHFCTG